MHWRYILNVVGILILVLGATMLLPLTVALYYGDGGVFALSVSTTVACAAGGLLHALFRGEKTDHLSQREGMAIVSLAWTLAGLFGALPFYFDEHFGPFVDAFFESVSGFTTTGSSILSNIEGVPKGLLFWRSLIQWMGGMGIIVLSIAILPFLGVGGMQLYKAEVPSPVPDKLKPRIQDTAKALWKVYVIFTVAEIALLLAGGMSPYDAVSHALTTMPTGGFSPKNASVAHYDSAYIDAVIIFFMFAAGLNFSLHYQFLRGKPLAFWKDTECRVFCGGVAALTFVVTLDIYGDVYDSIGKALQYASFQVVSILTTTGFATADYEQWPAMSQLILLVCMFLGGCAGSTGGGVKWLRAMLCFKYCYRELFALIHPRAVSHVKIDSKSVPEEVMRSVMGFLALYLGIFLISAVVLAGIGVDFVTSFGAVAATLGNIGPGFGTVGPVENFATIPVAGKWLLVWCMLLGRLEIFTILIMVVPEFWRK